MLPLVTMWGVRIVVVVLALAGNTLGCGAIFQGRHQRVLIETTPPGVEVSFGRYTLTTPAELEIGRRQDWYVMRAWKEGFHPACRVVGCPRNRALVFLDSIPAAIPLLVDLAAGTLRDCPEVVAVQLEPLPHAEAPDELPSDSDLLKAAEYGLTPCNAGGPVWNVLVTSGDIRKAYEILGPVEVNDALLQTRGIPPTPYTVDLFLRQLAVELYGRRVDAVINAVDASGAPVIGQSVWTGRISQTPGEVLVRGLAVEFTTEATVAANAPPSIPDSVEDRLRRVDELLKNGVITPKERDEQRKKILNEL